MIGVLYESGEWSDYKLAAELCEAGCSVRMIDAARLEPDEALEAAAECSLLVSRVFASAVFRGHGAAHAVMERLCAAPELDGVPMVNPRRAHGFEVDKALATRTLAAAGVDVPRVQACGTARDLDAGAWTYPCIIKPNCGGRTTFTAVARTEDEARAFLAAAPPIAFLVEDYLVPERGFLTRVELVDGACALTVKRSVVEGGLSAYHLGSTYELYDECSAQVHETALRAGAALDISFGSFDIIEREGRAFAIDANSVSNVSPDNTRTFGGFDLIREYAQAIARKASA